MKVMMTWMIASAAALQAVYAADIRLDPPEDGSRVPKVIWEKVLPEVDQIRTMQARPYTLPRRALFGESRASNREKINRLMDEVLEVLSLSSSVTIREDLSEIERANRADREEMQLLKERRVVAPQDAVWEDTVEEINDRIKRLEERIEARHEEADDLRKSLAESLRATGLELSEAQLDFLLGTVIGDRVFDIAVVFHNVRLLSGQLEALTEESLEDLNSTRRYYGMYTVLLEVLLHLYEESISQIDGDYLPEIERIQARTRSLIRDTRELLGRSPEEHHPALQANLSAQDDTARAAELYGSYLVDQRKGLREASEKLMADLKVAENTLSTVELSADLLSVMRSSEDLFRILFTLQIPELRPFENLELQREFSRLTEQLRQ